MVYDVLSSDNLCANHAASFNSGSVLLWQQYIYPLLQTRRASLQEYAFYGEHETLRNEEQALPSLREGGIQQH